MKNEYALSEAAGKISELSQKPISSNTLGNILDLMYPIHVRNTRWVVTHEQVMFIAQYWNEWGYKKGDRPSIDKWSEQHNFKEPGPYFPIVKTVVVPKKIEPKDDRNIIKQMREIAREEIKKQLETIAKPKQITATRGRDNDPRIEEIRKKIQAFVFNEPIRINDVWNHLRNRFEERNGIKVFLVGAQSFPQWLLSEGWIDAFKAEYQGFLDELHDTVNKQGRLAL